MSALPEDCRFPGSEEGSPREDPIAWVLSWIVVGGESGPGARPFDVAWARSVIAQCREAGTKVFVKQLGAAPLWSAPPPVQWTSRKPDRKGGDMSEWPADIRVREMPTMEKSR